MRGRGHRQAGGALLAVLWLTAALSAIAFTLAATVRAEADRASRAVDSARAYYLAQGAIERFLLHLGWAQFSDPREQSETRFRPGRRRLRWEFPTGVVDLEITGEGGKLNVYSAPPQALGRLLVELGVGEDAARQIAAGIVARRARGQGEVNVSGPPSFSGPGASFLQMEDLLTVGGMTPDIYYGWWERDAEKRLVERGGVWRHLTQLEGYVVNVNYAAPAVLRAAGVPEGAVAAIVAAREREVLVQPSQLAASGLDNLPPLPGGMQLGFGGSSAYTVRATAQLNDRPARRSLAALVRYGRNPTEPALGVVRWHQAAN